MRARKDRETRAHLHQGTSVAITVGNDVADAGAGIRSLDRARAKYDDLVLVLGGLPNSACGSPSSWWQDPAKWRSRSTR